MLYFMTEQMALKNDLSAASTSPVNVTNSFLASLDLKICISDWKTMNNKAKDIPQIVTEAHSLWINPYFECPWKNNGD